MFNNISSHLAHIPNTLNLDAFPLLPSSIYIKPLVTQQQQQPPKPSQLSTLSLPNQDFSLSMAPAMAFTAEAQIPKMPSKPGFEDLRRRNEELQREVREREEREEKMRRELERTKERLRTAEEAEEMLCSQLGELEAEAVTQAMEFRRRIRVLMEELNEAKRIIGSRSVIKAQ